LLFPLVGLESEGGCKLEVELLPGVGSAGLKSWKFELLPPGEGDELVLPARVASGSSVTLGGFVVRVFAPRGEAMADGAVFVKPTDAAFVMLEPSAVEFWLLRVGEGALLREAVSGPTPPLFCPGLVDTFMPVGSTGAVVQDFG